MQQYARHDEFEDARVMGGIAYPDNVDEEAAYGADAAQSSQVSASTIVWWIAVTVGAMFATAVGIYALNYIVNSSYNGGDQGQWRNIDALNLNVTSIWEYLNAQFQCMSCAAGLLTVGNTYVNGTLQVANQSGGPPVDFIQVIQQLIAEIAVLEQQIQQVNSTVPPVPAAARLEVENFQALLATVPDTQFIPFTGTGFYGYERDPSGLFDTTNDNYTIITRPAIIQASAQVYFSANITESYLICFFMPFANSTPGAEPTLMSGIGETANITAFGGFEYAGVVSMVGSFFAQAGWEINIRCAIAQGNPIDVIVTSHLDLLETV